MKRQERIGACVARAKRENVQRLVDEGKLCPQCLAVRGKVEVFVDPRSPKDYDLLCDRCAVRCLAEAVWRLQIAVGELADLARISSTAGDWGLYPNLNYAVKAWGL